MGKAKAVTENDIGMVKRRLEDARMRMVYRYPFYGHLLLHLKFSLAKCGSAATDMTRIIFDPEFVGGISDGELDFLLKHEIMHCVLQHCIRGKGRNSYLFNIACDIVVNSNIIQSMGKSDFTVGQEEAMHLAPDGREGYLFSAEEVYGMLMDKYSALVRDVEEVLQEIRNDYGVGVDDHAIWQAIPLGDSLPEEWKNHLREAAKAASGMGDQPPAVRKLLEDMLHEAKLNWRAVLHDFIKEVNDRYDFSFVPPDRRFSGDDLLLPSFIEMSGESVEDLWFLIDTSGSVSAEDLTCAFCEIRAAIEQFDHLSGKLSFFDTHVSDPVDFSTIEELKKIEPVGGGGTSFHCIFDYMKKHNNDGRMPTALIILTDGYAAYPSEDVALEVPVLWIIAGDNDADAPWGITVHIR